MENAQLRKHYQSFVMSWANMLPKSVQTLTISAFIRMILSWARWEEAQNALKERTLPSRVCTPTPERFWRDVSNIHWKIWATTHIKTEDKKRARAWLQLKFKRKDDDNSLVCMPGKLGMLFEAVTRQKYTTFDGRLFGTLHCGISTSFSSRWDFLSLSEGSKSHPTV